MRITEAHVVEGNLYSFAGENETKYSFDCEIVATGTNGQAYVLKHIFSGKGYDSAYGVQYVVNSRKAATHMVAGFFSRE